MLPPRRNLACAVLSVLLQCCGRPRSCGGATAELGDAVMPHGGVQAAPLGGSPGEAGQKPNCRVSSRPSARLRILLPMNASRVAKGSLLVVRDVLCSAEVPCVLTISIDGLEWVAMPARKRAVQLHLPASLPAGRHLATVRTEGQHDADGPVGEGEEACVWFDVEGDSPNDEGWSSSSLNIAHPPDGSWFSTESVDCPGSGTIGCTFSLRVLWIVQTEATSIRILVNDTLYDDVYTDAMNAGGVAKEEGQGHSMQSLDLPIRLKHAGWYTIQVELMMNETAAALVKRRRAQGGGQLLSVATLEVEIVAAHEAELRRQDVRMW